MARTRRKRDKFKQANSDLRDIEKIIATICAIFAAIMKLLGIFEKKETAKEKIESPNEKGVIDVDKADQGDIKRALSDYPYMSKEQASAYALVKSQLGK